MDSAIPITATKPLSQEEFDAARRLVDELPPARCVFGLDAEETVGGDGPNCERPAAWLLVLSCGHDAPLCHEHAILIRGRLERGFVTTCTKRPVRGGIAHPLGMRVTFEWRKL